MIAHLTALVEAGIGELVTGQGTIPASGNRQRTAAAWVFDYEDGQLRESRHYFDMLTFLRQIGAA